MIKLLEKNSAVSWFLVIIMAVVIFSVSSLSFPGQPSGGFEFKSTAYHFVVFFLLAFFLLPAIVKGKKKKMILFAIIVAVLYGISDEFHQLFVPGRSSTFDDVLVNTAGILFASLIYIFSLKIRKK